MDNFRGVVVAKFATTTADGKLEQESNLQIFAKMQFRPLKIIFKSKPPLKGVVCS